MYLRLAIFPHRRCGNPATKQVVHQLRAVADAQHRNSQFKNTFITGRRIVAIYTVGAARKNNAFGIHFPDFLKTHRMGVNLAVHIAFPDSSGNQLIVLPAEVQDNKITGNFFQ